MQRHPRTALRPPRPLSDLQWPYFHAEAARAQNKRTAEYLLGIPMILAQVTIRMHGNNSQLIQSPVSWQNDLECRSRAGRTVKIEPTAQTVRHDVVEDM